jgi:hypothetical protein
VGSGVGMNVSLWWCAFEKALTSYALVFELDSLKGAHNSFSLVKINLIASTQYRASVSQ